MASAQVSSNISADLVWEVARFNNAFLVKRPGAGGVQLSRDPLNLTNKSSRKHAGFVNGKAVGLQSGEKGVITLTTKKTKEQNHPASNRNETTFRGDRSGPKIYKSVVNAVAKQGYRPDLRQEAVARASALRQSSKPAKDSPEKKVRGAKAKKTET